jgi:hypothetical protein
MLNRALLILPAIVFCVTGMGIAQDASREKGGPEYIYITPKKKPMRHMPYDEELKCVDCHKWNGVDAYTSATMTLKKSRTGRLPREKIRASIIDALKGAGNYREMYVLSTSFDNEPLGTCMEFTLDPQTLALYASSEKQTEKLFHIAANPSVCLVYVRHRDDYQYFVDPLGVQIVGNAVQLKAGDPDFEKALKICLESVHLPPGIELTPEMLKNIRNNQLITKVIPERIVITDHRFRTKGMHLKQIWEKQ